MWDCWMPQLDASNFWADQGDSSMVARFNHVPGGSNVLYMDGHTEFVRLHEKYPMLTEDQVHPNSLASFYLYMYMQSSGGFG